MPAGSLLIRSRQQTRRVVRGYCTLPAPFSVDARRGGGKARARAVADRGILALSTGARRKTRFDFQFRRGQQQTETHLICASARADDQLFSLATSFLFCEQRRQHLFSHSANNALGIFKVKQLPFMTANMNKGGHAHTCTRDTNCMRAVF